ncbi:MAG: hypothetical protein SWE60_03095 [Thermodesulfobacteriota bacterium]|nr:hypothetical protein [Thermodesulfobacteriota bacterium]
MKLPAARSGVSKPHGAKANPSALLELRRRHRAIYRSNKLQGCFGAGEYMACNSGKEPFQHLGASVTALAENI